MQQIRQALAQPAFFVRKVDPKDGHLLDYLEVCIPTAIYIRILHSTSTISRLATCALPTCFLAISSQRSHSPVHPKHQNPKSKQARIANDTKVFALPFELGSATASSSEKNMPPNRGIDRNDYTRWGSEPGSDNEWFQVRNPTKILKMESCASACNKSSQVCSENNREKIKSNQINLPARVVCQVTLERPYEVCGVSIAWESARPAEFTIMSRKTKGTGNFHRVYAYSNANKNGWNPPKPQPLLERAHAVSFSLNPKSLEDKCSRLLSSSRVDSRVPSSRSSQPLTLHPKP